MSTASATVPLLVIAHPDDGKVTSASRYRRLIEALTEAGLFNDGAVYGHRDLGLSEGAWREAVYAADDVVACTRFRCLRGWPGGPRLDVLP